MVADARHRHRRADHYDALRAAAGRRPASTRRASSSRSGAPGTHRAPAGRRGRFLGDSGPGETVLLRLHGELADHAESVLLPLLLPDAPVVAWWPGDAPAVPAEDPVGRLAQRRVTDAAAATDPAEALALRAAGYQPGDTDLAWTRITPWRTLLAAALDQPYQTPLISAEVACEPGSPSAELLARWLETRLSVPGRAHRERRARASPPVVLTSADGRSPSNRPDGRGGRAHPPRAADRARCR